MVGEWHGGGDTSSGGPSKGATGSGDPLCGDTHCATVAARWSTWAPPTILGGGLPSTAGLASEGVCRSRLVGCPGVRLDVGKLDGYLVTANATEGRTPATTRPEAAAGKAGRRPYRDERGKVIAGLSSPKRLR